MRSPRLACLVIVAALITLAGAPGDARALRPIDGGILFLPRAERDRRFAHMERYYTGHIVRAGPVVRRLAPGTPLPLSRAILDTFMAAEHVSGLSVLQDGRVRLERYAPGRGARDRWTWFSVTKSVTSTLVGAAIRDGSIASLDDPVTRHLPNLAGGGYDGVTIRQLLTMTSGVRWNEDYADPASDVVRLY